MRRLAAQLLGRLISLSAHFITAVRAEWAGADPVPEQRVYFANHTSNGDFVLIWTVLPPAMRARTRPVAAADYWLRSRLRRFTAHEVFRAVLIERRPEHREEDPVEQMVQALGDGSSLIIFPEGSRNAGPEALLPLKAGLFHLASARPDVALIPVWIENLNRVLPKGEVLPVPIVCTVTFGAALRLEPDEAKEPFLARAADALLALKEAAA